MTTARSILTALTTACGIEPSSYRSDGEICFLFGNGRGDAVLVTIARDGKAACFAHINGADTQRKYERMDDVPDGFILDALKELTCLPQ